MAIDRSKYLDANEVRRLRTVTEAWSVTDLAAGRKRGPLVWACVDTALGTGLRVSEIVRLVVGDFDAKRAALRVWRLKRRKPIQETLPLSKSLTRHLVEFIDWKKLIGQPTGPKDVLFVGKRGRLTTAGLARIWKVACKRAGLPKEFSIHTARHTRGTTLLQATGNLRLVQRTLGHVNIASSALYAGVSFEDVQDALNAVDNVVDAE